MLCNRDCLHCPYPDCIDDGVDDEERAAADKRDIEALDGEAARKREARRREYRRIMADPARSAAYKAHQREYAKAHREKLLAYYRRHYAEHREERKAYQRAYAAAHKEQRKAWQREYNAKRKAERDKVK